MCWCAHTCVWDVLHELVYEGRQRAITHVPYSPLFYGNRNLAPSRLYMQCILASQDIFAKGNVSFPSDASQAWYRLLLRSKSAVNVDLSAKECNEQVKALFGVPAPTPKALTDKPKVLPTTIAKSFRY